MTDGPPRGFFPVQEVQAMPINRLSDRATVPLGVGVLAITAITVGWLVFEGAPFVLGCVAMLALTASEIALLVRPTQR
jgi:hypothetical protein